MKSLPHASHLWPKLGSANPIPRPVTSLSPVIHLTVSLVALQRGQLRERTSEVDVVKEYMNDKPEVNSKNASRCTEGIIGSKVVGSISEAMRVSGIDLSLIRNIHGWQDTLTPWRVIFLQKELYA